MLLANSLLLSAAAVKKVLNNKVLLYVLGLE